MSLWEKWEREKMEKMGIKIERPNNAQVYDMRPKANSWKQAGLILSALIFCCAVVYAAVVIFTGSSWADTYIVRLFAERNEVRQKQQAERDRANP